MSLSAYCCVIDIMLIMFPCYLQPPFYSRDTAEMYENILQKPLRTKGNISLAARDLLEKVRSLNVFFKHSTMEISLFFLCKTFLLLAY